MQRLKKLNFFYKSIIIYFLFLILITLLNYFDVFKTNFSNILIYISFFILIILNSFKISLKSKDKGIITGLKIGGILSFLIIILKLIFKIKFNLFSYIYIILIFLFSIFASIYGANKKNN